MPFLSRPGRSFPLAVGALLLGASGCLFSPTPVPPGPCTGDDCRAPTRDTIDGVLRVYEFAWQQKRLPEYEQLLHARFEYFPQEDDVGDLPWLQGSSWGRTDELRMAANMFNPEFLSEETGESVDSIEMTLTTTLERATPDGVEVTTDADIQVLWSASSGAFSRVRFVFLVVEDPDEPGLFQIRRQDELPEFN